MILTIYSDTLYVRGTYAAMKSTLLYASLKSGPYLQGCISESCSLPVSHLDLLVHTLCLLLSSLFGAESQLRRVQCL